MYYKQINDIVHEKHNLTEYYKKCVVGMQHDNGVVKNKRIKCKHKLSYYTSNEVLANYNKWIRVDKAKCNVNNMFALLIQNTYIELLFKYVNK